MSLATDIQEAADEVGASAQAAADRVIAAIDATKAERDQARADLAAYIEAHPDESGVLQGVLDSLNTTDVILDSIEAAPEPPPDE